MENKIDVSVNQETQTQILQGVAALKTLMPFLIKLSNKQRDALHKLSDGRKPFTEKALYYGTNNTNLDVSAEMLAAFNHDFSLYSFLSNLEQELLQLREMVHDTKQLAGAESLVVASFIYLVAKLKLKLGVPGMQTIVDDLGKLFEQSSDADSEEETK
jgi:hypothetical protein